MREREERSKKKKERVVGVSVSEWETESQRESGGEGDCERKLLYRYNRRTQLCCWPKPEWSQAAPVIHLYLLESGPFRIFEGGEKAPHLSSRREIFVSVGGTFLFILTMKSNI